MSISFHGSGCSIEPSQLDFAQGELAKDLVVRSGTGRLEILATPPGMAVATIRAGIASRWAHGYARIDLEDCARIDLLVRTRPDAPSAPLELHASNGVRQVCQPQAHAAIGYATYRLSEISDTAASVRACDLRMVSGSATVRVARIEPKRIATGAELLGGVVKLNSFTGGDVELSVWSLRAPWIAPATGLVDADGAMPLPAQLSEQGAVVVSWRRSDPWIPADWPWLPEPSEATVAFADGEPAGNGSPAPTDTADAALPILQAWHALAMADRFPQAFDWLALSRRTRRLTEEPAAALRVLGTIAAPADQRPALLIRSGVLWARARHPEFDAGAPDPDRLERTDRLTGALLALPALLAGGMPGIDADRWRAARDVYGREVVEIILDRDDPAMKSGSFANGQWFERLGEDEQDRLIRSLRLVPKAMLDADSRTAAALELFRRRHLPSLQAAGRQGRDRLSFHHAVFRDWKWDQASNIMHARAEVDERGGWVSLSAQSIGFALMAQVVSRGDQYARAHLEADFRHWLAIAQAAPELAALDIVLAEAMALAQFTPDVPADPFATDADQEPE